MKDIRLENIRFCQHLMMRVRELYYNSFPPEERRAWNNIQQLLVTDSSPYNIDVVLCGGDFVGFISWWQFPTFCYVEHFAVEPTMRGEGIGSRTVLQFVENRAMPIVLEVELPQEGVVARRRIAFYSRNGFMAHADFEYMQPSYGKGLPSVPLMLMTVGMSVDVDLKAITQQLHEVVYGVK